MRIGRNEIVEELTEHMRKVGGEAGEWCVGTAGQETHLPSKMPNSRADLPRMAHREAHTTYAAAEAVEYLIDAFGLHRDRNSRPGNIVYIYRPTTVVPSP